MASKVNLNPAEKILKGINTVADVTEVTLGPLGRNVGISKGDGKGPIWDRMIIHDGVKVAKSVDLKDEEENFAAQVLIEAAKKTLEVGDGTTATISLARAIFTEAYRVVAAGENPMPLVRELEAGVEKVVKFIKTLKKDVTTLEQKEQVATISAQDPIIGKLIASVIDKVGADGLVTVDESKSNETYVDYQEGMQFDKGFTSPYFITNPDTNEATLRDTKILIADLLLTPQQMLPFLTEVLDKKGLPLTIITPELSVPMRDFLIINKLQGKIQALAITAPNSGDKQQSILQDIAILTGGRFISRESGTTPDKVTFADLGNAERITATQAATVIVGGSGDKEAIQSRITALYAQLETEEADFEQDKLKERIAKLSQGIAVIKVGGATEIEMKERLERVDDAVHATIAAVRGGIVPGGEIVYLNAKQVLQDPTVAHSILRKALERPFRKLVENAGYDAGEIMERLQPRPKSFGFNVVTGEIRQMINEGIIDPLEVPVNALRNAVSVSAKLLTTAALITPEREEK